MKATKLNKDRLFGFAQVKRDTGALDLDSGNAKNLVSKIDLGPGEFPGPPAPPRSLKPKSK